MLGNYLRETVFEEQSIAARIVYALLSILGAGILWEAVSLPNEYGAAQRVVTAVFGTYAAILLLMSLRVQFQRQSLADIAAVTAWYKRQAEIQPLLDLQHQVEKEKAALEAQREYTERGQRIEEARLELERLRGERLALAQREVRSV